MTEESEQKRITRLEILEASLLKKQERLKQLERAHYEDVARANGQPLNDKRNGQTTLKRWDRQREALRKQVLEIEKTLDAIEFEKGLQRGCEKANEEIPSQILSLVESGKIVQWRKHPNRFFVVGVDKARIIWDPKKKTLSHSYIKQIPDAVQFGKFKEVYNDLHISLHKI